jgi:beta-glucanase (GH16 family)
MQIRAGMEDNMEANFKWTAVALAASAWLAGAAAGETLRQDFTSMAELGEFWNISTWGGENRTHSAANVTIDGGVLNLKLSASPPGVKPVCAEITSKRNNFRYGSYNASIKTSKTPGGVVGWFTYLGNPLNEIDVEMLTKDNRDLHFTLHHIQTGVDYKVVKLAFDPSEAFHEYRFDWYPGRVEYFLDGKPIATLTKQVPDMDSQIMLNHWSGNIDGWGGPAPTKDMFMYVDWMTYSSDYPKPTTLQAKAIGKPSLRPGTLAFDAGTMKAVFRDADVSLSGPGNAPAAMGLFTVQGRKSPEKTAPHP